MCVCVQMCVCVCVNVCVKMCVCGGASVQLFGVREAHVRVILLVHEGIWNAHALSLVFPSFDDTGSPGYPPRWMV